MFVAVFVRSTGREVREESRGQVESTRQAVRHSKRAAWEAWEKVKANKGAPGVDERTIANLEADLKGALRSERGPLIDPPRR